MMLPDEHGLRYGQLSLSRSELTEGSPWISSLLADGRPNRRDQGCKLPDLNSGSVPYL